jgi:FAD/FMN-containing dehydrogenase
MTAQPANFSSVAVIDALKAVLPPEAVNTDETTCVLMAQDVFTRALPALAVVRPATVDQLSAAVKAAASAGVAVIPRGGGMSYTSGYVPAEPDSVVVDLSGLNRIVEINETDMYVVVEAGCTWADLHAALKPKGLRTPFWGTLSGRYATIGGGISQNSVFWGCGQYGSAVDSVLGLDVVLADGTVVGTGMLAQRAGQPFFRHFGPDYTGLFTADAGAHGFKARIALRLIPAPEQWGGVSFSLPRYEALQPLMSALARAGLGTEVLAFDPFLQAQRMKRDSLAKDVKALANVMKSSGSVFGALKDAVQIATAGRSFLDDVPYSLHVIVEGRSEAAVEADLKAVRALAKSFGAEEIDNSIPKILRANPFGPVNNMVGPQGERWVPIHCLLPHSKGLTAMAGIEAIYARHQAAMDRFQIGCGFLFLTVSTSVFLIEPVFFWPDAMTEIHRHYVEPDHLARLKGFPEDLAAREAVQAIRADLLAYFLEIGSAHLQVGKTYRWRDGLTPEAERLAAAVKAALDPDRRVNPGALGF